MRILSNTLSGLGVRFYHATLANLCRLPNPPTNKALLAELRKRTGYTFSNCKKALERHGYDVEKAEKWLKEQAHVFGWAKATKLEGRPTAQGLIAVMVNQQNAAIVEVNCETDFVARNKTFITMVEDVVKACITFSEQHEPIKRPYTKLHLDTERLKHLTGPEGRSLADQLNLVIGQVGENLSLRRAMCLQAGPGIKLAGYAHPSPPTPTENGSFLGKYGALVALRQNQSSTSSISDQLGRELCQHVVGMNPSKIGQEGEDLPVGNADDERCLIYQEYLLDPSRTVAQLVGANNVEVIEFTRFECGEVMTDPLGEETHIDLALEQGG